MRAVLRALWRVGEGSVEEVRASVGSKPQVAYTTVQTQLNQLVDKGLAVRERKGRAFVYRATQDQDTYLVSAISAQLEGVSPRTARRVLRQVLKEFPPRS